MSRISLGLAASVVSVAALAAVPAGAAAQDRPLSPPGHAATQVGGTHTVQYGNLHGAWLDVYYGRPIKRGRDLFGPRSSGTVLPSGAPAPTRRRGSSPRCR